MYVVQTSIFFIKCCLEIRQMIFIISDQKATAILPLADEYQIEGLKKLCATELKKFTVPRLEYVSLGLMYNLHDLAAAAIGTCAEKLSLEEIDKQQKLPENKDVISNNIVLLILRWVPNVHQFYIYMYM